MPLRVLRGAHADGPGVGAVEQESETVGVGADPAMVVDT